MPFPHWTPTNSYDPHARRKALAAGLRTYQGRECAKCQGTERHVEGSYCVQCYPNRGGGNGNSTYQEKPIRTALGKAIHTWLTMQRESPGTHPYRLWPRFLAGLDEETREAAIKAIDAPSPPTISTQKATANRLAAYAETSGVLEIERKVRQALAAGDDRKAASLRNEALALMRQGAAQVHCNSIRASSGL
jgi:hypothetical protein